MCYWGPADRALAVESYNGLLEDHIELAEGTEQVVLK